MLRSVISLLITSIFVSCVLSAPRPSTKAPKPKEVTPGEYKMIWNGGEWQILLKKNGEYECSGGWIGSWGYDTNNRTFAVSETINGGASWLTWWASLDGELKGKGGSGGGGETTLELIKK